MDRILKTVPGIFQSAKKNSANVYFGLERPRNVSDHKIDSKNGILRQFAIGAMPLVSLRVALSQKLWSTKVRSVLEYESTLFFEACYYNSSNQY